VISSGAGDVVFRRVQHAPVPVTSRFPGEAVPDGDQVGQNAGHNRRRFHRVQLATFRHHVPGNGFFAARISTACFFRIIEILV